MEYAVGGITDTPLKPVTAVALLDGVPWKNTIKRIESGNCQAPLLSIRADKSAWNANWSVIEAESGWKGDVIAVHLKGTSHIDPENPPDKLGNIVMRASKPERRLVFAELVAEFFRARLLGQSSEFENKLKELEENGDTVTKSDR